MANICCDDVIFYTEGNPEDYMTCGRTWKPTSF